MTTDKGKTDIFFVQLIKTENLRIKFSDDKKTYGFKLSTYCFCSVLRCLQSTARFLLFDSCFSLLGYYFSQLVTRCSVLSVCSTRYSLDATHGSYFATCFLLSRCLLYSLDIIYRQSSQSVPKVRLGKKSKQLGQVCWVGEVGREGRLGKVRLGTITYDYLRFYRLVVVGT